LPGNSSINTVQQAKKKRLGSVFYVRAEQRWNNGVMQPVSKQRLSLDPRFQVIEDEIARRLHSDLKC
jgi:hypothetical protein